MRILLIALPLLAIAAAQPPKSIKQSDLDKIKAACAKRWVSADRPGAFWRLNETPPANAYQAVFRQDDQGCAKSWIAADKIRPRNR